MCLALLVSKTCSSEVSTMLQCQSHPIRITRPTQYGHHPDIDAPLPDVRGQRLRLSGGQGQDWAEGRVGQADRGGGGGVGDRGQDELVMTNSICSNKQPGVGLKTCMHSNGAEK